MTFIYKWPFLYRLIMQILYGKSFEEKYSVVNAAIPENAQVADLCSGDCAIYSNYLSKKNVSYVGYDLSDDFIQAARKKGIRSEIFDMNLRELPKAEYLIMMSSLYQFFGEADSVIKKMLLSAEKKVIITEPVKNMAQSQNSLLALIAKKLTKATNRFNEKSLKAVIAPYQDVIESQEIIADGREMVVVLNASKYRSHSLQK